MSRQKIVIAIVLLTFVATGLTSLFVGGPPKPAVRTSGASVAGGAEASAALWARMAKLRAWLPSFEEAFKDPEPEAKTVLSAFAALADKLAGPKGFWRDTVPNEILDCARGEQPVCQKLAEALPELTDGEAMARSIGRLDSTRAELFLSRNAEALLAWVDVFAPSEPSAQGMRGTTFWEQKLAPAVAGPK